MSFNCINVETLEKYGIVKKINFEKNIQFEQISFSYIATVEAIRKKYMKK